MYQEGDIAAAANLLRVADSSGLPDVSQTCSRRYSEVMKEYLRRRQHQGNETDEHNIKPSEVVTLQADHTGPSGTSYVSWDNLETPGVFVPCVQPIPVVEDPCVVHQVQEVRSSPRLSLYEYSPVTPESGAESYTTAKTHIPTESPPSRSHSRLAQGYHSLHENLQMVPVSADRLQPERCKAPLINIFSAGGSPEFHTFRHTNQDEEDNSDFDLQPPFPMHLLQSGGVDSSDSFTDVQPSTDEKPCSLSAQGLTLPSRTFVVDSKHNVTFVRASVINDETAVTDVSVMRDEACQAEENLLNPVTLDFERDSFLDSDATLYPEEQVGELSYPPDETDTSSYKLNSKSPQSWGSEGSIGFSWLSSTRKGCDHNTITEEIKLKRLKVLGWVLVAVGFLFILAAVCAYFALG